MAAGTLRDRWDGRGVVFGLSTEVWAVPGVVAVVMCEWQLAHLGAARRVSRYGGVMGV